MPPIVAFCAITSLVNCVTTLLLGAFVLAKSHSIKANRYFSYFCFSVSVWALFYYFWLHATDNIIMSEYYMRTCMMPVFFMPALLFDFVTSFVGRSPSLWFRAFNYGMGFISICFVYTPFYAYGFSPFMGFNWLKAGPFFNVVLLHFGLLLFYTFWYLADAYQRTQDQGFKQQIKLVSIGLAITFVGGCTNYPPWYRIFCPPIANVTVPGYVVLMTYAILKYQLLDIKIVIKNSLVYSILVSVITVSYFSMIYLSEHILKNTFGYHSTVASITTALLVAIFFIPFKNFIQSIIEKYVFKATYAQIADQNDRLRRQIMISERYRTFSEIAKSMTVAVRDPLTTLKTYSYHLPKHYQDQVFLEKLNNTLKEQVQKIQDLMDGLNKYSSPDPLSLQKIDIYWLLNEVLNSVRLQLSDQKINLSKNYSETASFWLNVDSQQLKQVFITIVMYCLKSMPQGGQLWVDAKQGKEEFLIYVKNNGTTIPKEELERIFDPFWRYENENKGLELAIAFSIIENHGGRILVESSSEKGNEITIQLPII